ncbi:hypothetical protein L7F22_031387 [Adiantum nelumboides]|nr:hypothetical protein [Adiantum nelumboides]
MGSSGDNECLRKDAKCRESVIDVRMQENVCEAQGPNESNTGSSCGKEALEVGFIDGGTPAFKEAPGGSINQENLTNAHIQKAAEKALLLDGGQSTSIHTGKAYREVSIGPRRFTSSRDMLHFFNQLLNGWPLNLNINKYEHMMLEDLLKKGHPHFFEKAGTGIKAFQVRINKAFDSRCFYVVTKDGSMNDFSYRKCVDSIISLPKNLKSKFGREQNQKRDGRYKGDAHVPGSKSQHSKKGRERNFNGNGQHDSGCSGNPRQKKSKNNK